MKRNLIISKSLPPCEAAEIRIFPPCIISEALPSAAKAGHIADLATFSSRVHEPISSFSHVRADPLSPSAPLAFHRHFCIAFLCYESANVFGVQDQRLSWRQSSVYLQ